MFLIYFYSYLDDGRLTDNKGRTVNFNNTIIIMTSNIGSGHISNLHNKEDNLDKEKIHSLILSELKSSFRPEFLNRIDETIIFNSLSKKVITKIVEFQINELNNNLIQREIKLDISPYAVEYLSKKGFDPQYGARPIKRLVQKEILNQLSKEMLKGNIQKGDVILIDSFNDKIVFRTNYKKESKLKIDEKVNI